MIFIIKEMYKKKEDLEEANGIKLIIRETDKRGRGSCKTWETTAQRQRERSWERQRAGETERQRERERDIDRGRERDQSMVSLDL